MCTVDGTLIEAAASLKSFKPRDIVGVYYPNEQQVALGAKARTSTRITWN